MIDLSPKHKRDVRNAAAMNRAAGRYVTKPPRTGIVVVKVPATGQRPK